MKFQKFLKLSDVYKREEDFSKDLVDNLKEFLSRLSIRHFEKAEIEAIVGTRRADIVAENPTDRDVLVIENQFGKANWDHWGRLEAYARIKEATIAILIADGFEELMIETCNLRNEDSSMDWYLVQMQVTEHKEFHPIKVAGPQIDIQAEKRNLEYNEFWDPIRLGNGVFSGKRMLAKYSDSPNKTVKGVGIILKITKNRSYVHIWTSGDDRVEKRDKVYSILGDLNYQMNKSESSKHAFIDIPIMDKGQEDIEYWDEIREKLEGVGTDIYRKLEQVNV